jgi:toluene monooxygenase system protein E
MRTYSHLAKLGRKPTDYDIATTKLLYYPDRGGFETRPPIADWYRTYQRASPLVCRDWEQFRDPRETTYTKYTELQRAKETFVDGVLAAEHAGTPVTELIPVLRYPVHGLQMLAAYVGQMAPSGRIVVASLFQTADELRRVQRFAYRMCQLGIGADSRAGWERDPRWQPLREVIERMLVTYDWGEAFVALNLVLKPRFDDVFVTQLADRARTAGDGALANLLFSLDEDCQWHRAWSGELLRVALADQPANRAPIEAWLAKWQPLAMAACAPFGDGEAAARRQLAAVGL